MIGQKKDYDPKMDVPGRVVNGNLRCSFIKIIFSVFLFPIQKKNMSFWQKSFDLYCL